MIWVHNVVRVEIVMYLFLFIILSFLKILKIDNPEAWQMGYMLTNQH